jgi:integrase/recombinase XerC
MDLLTQFKNELLRQEKSENTISSYIKRIEDFLIWLSDRYDETDPTAITEIDVREYKSFCMNVKKYAPSGINQRLAAIKSYCDFLVGQDKLEYNPARKIKQVKIVKGKTAPDVLERNDYNKFKREFYKDNNKRNIAIFEVLSNTGIRVSELVNIEINDMDISERKGVLVVRGKGNKYREVPLNNTARKAIQDYLEVRPANKENKLFIGERGPITRSTVWRILKKYAERVGLEDAIHPHTMRHQFATRLLREKGIDLTTVKELLGHEDLNTTAIYTQPTRKEKQQAVETLNN